MILTLQTSTTSFKSLAIDFYLLVVVFLVATIVSSTTTTMDVDNGDDIGVDSQLKLLNKLKMNNDEDTYRRTVFSHLVRATTASSSSKSSTRKTNASIYSIKQQQQQQFQQQQQQQQQQRKTTNQTTTGVRKNRTAVVKINENKNIIPLPAVSFGSEYGDVSISGGGGGQNNRSGGLVDPTLPGGLGGTGIDYIGYNARRNVSESGGDGGEDESFDDGHSYDYWALILIIFPISTIFGNSLVVLSVIKEKNLRTVTNYFVVSLAIADLTVATAVMPFAVYLEVSNTRLAAYYSNFDTSYSFIKI
jgi:hypothetical protein